MKVMANNKSRDRVFLYALIASMVLHLVIIYPRSGRTDKEIELPSKKAGFTFINFSINDNGRHHEFRHLKDNKNDDREKSAFKKPGDLPAGKTGAEKNRNSPAPASLSKNPVEKIMKTYKSRVLSRIQRMKYYPLTARRMNQEGVVVLRFILRKDGTLAGSVKLVKGCEHEMLNRAGVKTIYKSLPFPSFPDVYLDENMEFNVQLVYNLNLIY